MAIKTNLMTIKGLLPLNIVFISAYIYVYGTDMNHDLLTFQ